MSRIVPKQRALKVLNRLIQNGVVERVETVYEKYTPKTVRFVRLAEDYCEDVALQDVLNQLQRIKTTCSYYAVVYHGLQAGGKSECSNR